MAKVTASYIGAMCGEYRRLYMRGTTQKDVAMDVGCSRELVSKFERGTLPNAVVFLWYIQHGLFDWVPPEKWQGWGCAISG